MFIPLASCLALALIETLWICTCLMCWLGLHRRAPKSRIAYPRRARARICGAAHQTIAELRKPHWRSKPEWACKQVIYFAAHGRSCRWIEATFNRRHGEYMTVGHSWVAEYIKAHAHDIAERRRAMRRNPPRSFAVGHTGVMDLTFMVNEQGFLLTMLGIIDRGSRRLLCLKQLPRKCTLMLLGHLLLTMARFGGPAVIRTDNESMFVSTFWRAVLAAFGICHRRSQLACPWQNGRIERLFGTLKPILRSIQPNNAAALNRVLREFERFYQPCAGPSESQGTHANGGVARQPTCSKLRHNTVAENGCRRWTGDWWDITFDVDDARALEGTSRSMKRSSWRTGASSA